MQYAPESPAQSLPRGTLLNNGRYRIERELNRGATAVVYAAEDVQQPGKFVALKCMHGPEQVPVRVVKREIAFSAQAKHPNVVRLLDVFAEKTQLVIVWELISGPDLLDLLNEHAGCMPEPLAAFYFCQLLQAVMFMHTNGFCHRDIKPENAMIVRANHQLKLIDFGLSKHLQSARTRGVGTPDYLSPEMLQVWNGYSGNSSGGPAPYDARAVDAWAMGVLMYLLVTGKYPFEDPAHPNNLPHTIQNVLAGRLRPFPDHVSHGCRQLIENLLKIEPSHRTTLMDLTMDDWLVGQAYRYAQSVGALNLLQPLLQERQKGAAMIQQQQQLQAGVQHGSSGLQAPHHHYHGSSSSPHAMSPSGPASGPNIGAAASPQHQQVRQDEHVHNQQAASSKSGNERGSQGSAANTARAEPTGQPKGQTQQQGASMIQSAHGVEASAMTTSAGSDGHGAQLHPAIYSGWPTGNANQSQGNAAAGQAGSEPTAMDVSPSPGGVPAAHVMSPGGHDDHGFTALEEKKSKGAFSKMCNYLKRKLAS